MVVFWMEYNNSISVELVINTNPMGVVTTMLTISISSNIRQWFSQRFGREHQVVNSESLDCIKNAMYQYWAGSAYAFQIADSIRLSAICSVEVEVPHDHFHFIYFVLCFSLIITFVIMKITLNKSFQIKKGEQRFYLAQGDHALFMLYFTLLMVLFTVFTSKAK